MRYFVLILSFFISVCSIPTFGAATEAVGDKGVLIRSIEIEGFVLGDKSRFVKLFKPYRNKYLTNADTEDLLKKIQDIYEREGYQQLVSVTYRVNKHRLVFSALMTS